MIKAKLTKHCETYLSLKQLVFPCLSYLWGLGVLMMVKHFLKTVVASRLCMCTVFSVMFWFPREGNLGHIDQEVSKRGYQKVPCHTPAAQ